MSKKARERKKAAKKSAKKRKKVIRKKPKKVKVDKWKLKQWYTLISPALFEERELGEVPVMDQKNLLNRKIVIPLAQITGKYNEQGMYCKLAFRVVDIKGKHAMTKLVGHELARGYLNTLVRRRRSAVDDVIDVKTKDGEEVRVKVIVVTTSKISSSKKTAMRLILRDELKKASENQNFGEFMQTLIFGKFPVQVQQNLKKIAPVRRVEVRKTEVKRTVVRMGKES